MVNADGQQHSIPWTGPGSIILAMWKRDTSQTDDEPDMLATMMEQQRRHMEIYEREGGHPSDSGIRPLHESYRGNLEARQTHEFFRRCMGYAVEEIYEAVGLFKGKPWKKNFSAPDEDMVRDEIGDALHFFFEALIALGWTAEDVFQAYFKTSAKNIERQNSDY